MLYLFKDWKNVRRLLKDQEATLVEMARLEKYADLVAIDDTPILEKGILEKVQTLIGMYSESDIRKIDNTAAAYYRWVCWFAFISYKKMFKTGIYKHSF